MNLTTEKIIPVVIVDDHAIFRIGLKQIIESSQGISVVGEASNGIMAIDLVEELKPEVIVLDVDMPECNGIETARMLKRKNLPVEIVILTMYSEEDIFNEIIEIGVKGFVLKDNATTEIIDAIKSVSEGKHYITSALSGLLLKNREKTSSSKNILNNLTAMESRVLSLIAENKSSKEIADELHISYKTVENHRANICTKLNLHGSNVLLKFALDNKKLILS
ncbi:MAG: DNA-binding response regulator [Ignavibacteriales bacterium]|nr:MAG: DNA-binding response regulator [Ignavibacteriales bacterium]